MTAETQQQTEQQEPTAEDWAAEDAPEPAQRPDEPAPDQGGEPESIEGEPEAEPQAGDDPAPEFWTAEAKALWDKVPPELRPHLRDMNAKERAAVSKRLEEAAGKERAADQARTKYDTDLGHVAQWFEQNGAHIVSTIHGRWAGMTADKWQDLARANPAQYVEAKAMYDADMQQAANVARKHQEVRSETQRRAAEDFTKSRTASHAELARDMPAEFGPEKAQATYNTLSAYLVSQGVPAERIPLIHEPYVVKTVLKAYKYDQLQAKMKQGVTSPPNGQQNATTTPRRIQPGPASNGSGNRQTDAQRQADEALRSGRKLTAEELAAAFR